MEKIRCRKKTGYCIFCSEPVTTSDSDVEWAISKRKTLSIWHKGCMQTYIQFNKGGASHG